MDNITHLGFNSQQKFEPGRTVYVLLHLDESHILGRPDGEPAWSYSEEALKVTQKILERDLKNNNYRVTTLDIALPLIGNKQAELEKEWRVTIKAIRKEKNLNERVNIYRKKLKRSKKPHPILFDTELKQLLKID